MNINFPYPSESQKLISEIEVQKNELKVFNSYYQCKRVLKNIFDAGLNSSRLDILICNLRNNILFEYPVRKEIFNILKYSNYHVELEENDIYKLYFYLYDDKTKDDLRVILSKYSQKLINFDSFLKNNISNLMNILNLPKELKQEFPILKIIIKYLNSEKIIKQFDSWIFSLLGYINFIELEDKNFENYILKKINNRDLDIFLSKLEDARIQFIFKKYKSSENTKDYLSIGLKKEGYRSLVLNLSFEKDKIIIPNLKYFYVEAYNRGYISKKNYNSFIRQNYIKENKFKILLTILIMLLLGIGGYFIIPKLIK